MEVDISVASAELSLACDEDEIKLVMDTQQTTRYGGMVLQ